MSGRAEQTQTGKIGRLQSELDFHLARIAAKTDRDMDRCWGMSSDALLLFASGGPEVPLRRYPFDAADLNACVRMWVMAPLHLRTKMDNTLDKMVHKVAGRYPDAAVAAKTIIDTSRGEIARGDTPSPFDYDGTFVDVGPALFDRIGELREECDRYTVLLDEIGWICTEVAASITEATQGPAT